MWNSANSENNSSNIIFVFPICFSESLSKSLPKNSDYQKIQWQFLFHKFFSLSYYGFNALHINISEIYIIYIDNLLMCVYIYIY